jgi:hypothetical protein
VYHLEGVPDFGRYPLPQVPSPLHAGVSITLFRI